MAYTSDSIENIIKSLTIGGKTYPLGVQYADKADSMNVTAAVGTSKRPIYLKADGTFAQTTYSLGKTVPSTAVFTDTTYQLTLNGTTNGAGTTDLGTIYAPTSAGTNGQYLASNGTGAPIWADFSSLLSPYVTKQNLEAYGNWITIFANESNNYDAGFKVLNETTGESTIIDSEGIYFQNSSTVAMICLQNNSNDLYLGPTNVAIDGALNIDGSELHLGRASADVTISTDVDHINSDNSTVTTIDSRLKVDNTIYLSTDQSDHVSISTNAHAADPSVKTLFIDSDLEIGSTLYLSDNQIDYSSIWTDGGGDLFFSGTNFEFAQSGNFTVLGPISLKGAANTGSATNPIYIDNLGKFKATTHTLGASVPSGAKFTDTTYKLALNGTTKGGGSTNLGSIYAPTSGGTSGQYLKSNGSGAPTWVDLPDFSCIMIGTPENPNMVNDENVVTIDNGLEIGGTLYLTDNYNDWVSISTDGGDVTFNASRYEFTQPGDFVVNGPVSLKGAKNTGSSTKPVYIDNLGKFRPINYDIGDLVNQISQLQNRISQLESIITSYIGPIN